MTITELKHELNSYMDGFYTEHSFSEIKFQYENEYIEVSSFANSNKWINNHSEMETSWSIICTQKKDFQNLNNWQLFQREFQVKVTPVTKGHNIGKMGIRLTKMKKSPDVLIIKRILDFIFSEITDSFSDWLFENTKLSETSIKHYENGVHSISKLMLSNKVISVPLEEMTVSQLEVAMFNIFNNDDFIRKDTIGKRMYSNSLKHFLSFVKDSSMNFVVYEEEVKDITDNQQLSITEKDSLVKARIGQGTFRKLVIEKYAGKCILSGISDPRLLIASHIKPWSVSDNMNRISSENGLLLNALYDKMFDLGLISFSDNAFLLISSEINPTNRILINLKDNLEYPLKYTIESRHNMEYHRDMIFLKGKND